MGNTPFTEKALTLTMHKFKSNSGSGTVITSYVSIRGGGMVLRMKREIQNNENATSYMARVMESEAKNIMQRVGEIREICYNSEGRFERISEAIHKSPTYRRYKPAILKEAFIAITEDAMEYNGATTIPHDAVEQTEFGYWFEYHSNFIHRRYVSNTTNTSRINPPVSIRYSRAGIATHNVIWKCDDKTFYFLKGSSIEIGVN
jgi:hypothetical protein